MADLNLLVSERLGDGELDSLLNELRAYVSVGEPRCLLRKSVDPALPSVIQLVGSLLAWLPLSVVATAYLAALGKQAGDATWTWLTRPRRNDETKPVSEMATALARAAAGMGSNAEVVLGLDDADGGWEMAIAIQNPEPEEVARILATFVAHVEQLALGVRAEMDTGRGPRGPVVVEVDSNGDLVARWRARDGETDCTVRVPTSRNE